MKSWICRDSRINQGLVGDSNSSNIISLRNTTRAPANMHSKIKPRKQKQLKSVIRPSSLNILGGTWKLIFLPDIRDMSTLELSPFHRIALHKSTFTYLLTCVLCSVWFRVVAETQVVAVCEERDWVFIVRHAAHFSAGIWQENHNSRMYWCPFFSCVLLHQYFCRGQKGCRTCKNYLEGQGSLTLSVHSIMKYNIGLILHWPLRL